MSKGWSVSTNHSLYSFGFTQLKILQQSKTINTRVFKSLCHWVYTVTAIGIPWGEGEGELNRWTWGEKHLLLKIKRQDHVNVNPSHSHMQCPPMLKQTSLLHFSISYMHSSQLHEAHARLIPQMSIGKFYFWYWYYPKADLDKLEKE